MQQQATRTPPKNWKAVRHIFGDWGAWEDREAQATRPPGVPLMALGMFQCRWPVAEDPAAIGRHLFCARPTDGFTYCRLHRQLAR
jgi:hypothetical protein